METLINSITLSQYIGAILLIAYIISMIVYNASTEPVAKYYFHTYFSNFSICIIAGTLILLPLIGA